MSDKERMLFLIDRESDPSNVIDFAFQARCVYRSYILNAKIKYGKFHTYRRNYIESYLFHKAFIKNNSDDNEYKCVSMFY